MRNRAHTRIEAAPVRAIAGGLLGVVLLLACSSVGKEKTMVPISVDNANKVKLLKSLEIPGYRRGAISQCSVAFSPDGSLLACAAGVGPISVWDMKSGELRHLLDTATSQKVACAFSPDGKMLACGGFDKTVTAWNPVSGERLGTIGGHDSPVWELDFSPDGRRLVSCSLADDIRMWDVEGGVMAWSHRGTGAFLSVAFDPSGARVAYGGRWGIVGLVDASTGADTATLVEHIAPVGDVTFSPSGRLVAAGTDDDVIRVWSADDSREIAILEGHDGYVNGVAFSRTQGDTLLASGSHDGTVRLWDIAAQKQLATLEGHTAQVLRLAFSPDGTMIASVGWDGMIRIWSIPIE